MNNNIANNTNDEIDLKELFFVLWSSKYKIIIICFLFSVSAIFYSLSLPNIYKSEAVLSSASSSGSNLSSLASQYSGVADLAGISLPSSGGSDKVEMGIEIIKSLNFFEKLVEKHDLLFELQAPMGWDASKNKLIINPELYDTKLDKWVSDQSFAVNGKPSIQTAHRDFLRQLSVNVDKKTRFIYISIEHFSPYVAKKILDLILIEINEMIRDEDIRVAKDSIAFLTKESLNTQLNEVRSGINDLIEKQIETIAFANASPEYLVKTLSPPYVPELKALPDRKLIVIISLIIGFILSSMFYSIKYYFFNQGK